jgi:hypothetical protein
MDPHRCYGVHARIGSGSSVLGRLKGGLRPAQTLIVTMPTMTTYEGRRKAHHPPLLDRLFALFRRHPELRETAPIPVVADYRHRPYVPPPPPAPYRFPPGRTQ